MSLSITVLNDFKNDKSTNVILSSGCDGNIHDSQPIHPGDEVDIPYPEDCTNINLDKKHSKDWWIKIVSPPSYEFLSKSGMVITGISWGVEDQSNEPYIKFNIKPAAPDWVLILKNSAFAGIAQPTNVTIGDN